MSTKDDKIWASRHPSSVSSSQPSSSRMATHYRATGSHPAQRCSLLRATNWPLKTRLFLLKISFTETPHSSHAKRGRNGRRRSLPPQPSSCAMQLHTPVATPSTQQPLICALGLADSTCLLGTLSGYDVQVFCEVILSPTFASHQARDSRLRHTSR